VWNAWNAPKNRVLRVYGGKIWYLNVETPRKSIHSKARYLVQKWRRCLSLRLFSRAWQSCSAALPTVFVHKCLYGGDLLPKIFSGYFELNAKSHVIQLILLKRCIWRQLRNNITYRVHCNKYHKFIMCSNMSLWRTCWVKCVVHVEIQMVVHWIVRCRVSSVCLLSASVSCLFCPL